MFLAMKIKVEIVSQIKVCQFSSIFEVIDFFIEIFNFNS
jgi:hypothetical protein